RVGVYFAGIAADMTREVIEEHELFDGVQTLWTFWEWSELFLRHGFRIAITAPRTLDRVWKIETEANEGDAPWYPDAASLRYCFFTKPNASTAPAKRRRAGRRSRSVSR